METLGTPTSQDKKTVINVRGTNAWLFKDYLGTMGLCYRGFHQKKIFKFENLTIKHKKEKLVDEAVNQI